MKSSYSRCINLKLQIKHTYLNLLQDSIFEFSMIVYDSDIRLYDLNVILVCIFIFIFIFFCLPLFLADLFLHDPQMSRHSCNPKDYRCAIPPCMQRFHQCPARLPTFGMSECAPCLQWKQKMLCNTSNAFTHSEATKTRLTLH